MSIKARMNRVFKTQIRDPYVQHIKDSVVEAIGDLHDASPHDTGFLKSNWEVNVGHARGGLLKLPSNILRGSNIDLSGRRRVKSNARRYLNRYYDGSTVIYIQNRTIYAEGTNSGRLHIVTAPIGYINRPLAMFRARIKKIRRTGEQWHMM